MISWWTNQDIEIVCNHGDDMSYIQNGNGERHIAKCPDCGQEYIVELIVIPDGEIEIPEERLEVLK